MEGKDFRKIEVVLEALKRHRTFQTLLEGTTPFIIYRVDTGMLLARNIYTFEDAKAKSNEVRKKHGLRWDQVKFRRERAPRQPLPNKGRIDYSRYNPSKRGSFKVRINPDGSTADLD